MKSSDLTRRLVEEHNALVADPDAAIAKAVRAQRQARQRTNRQRRYDDLWRKS